ncbi:hypothetical protein HPP92_018022 [Vanilla planifolia]|uniref:Uncharacterized protein n=1 Tax=Vanilla planifolia TaxID=51239 RepID=A0A835QC09_VANPL|nr:hypothetical protein HPP92_018022 [Vanilla planifolia]
MGTFVCLPILPLRIARGVPVGQVEMRDSAGGQVMVKLGCFCSPARAGEEGSSVLTMTWRSADLL